MDVAMPQPDGGLPAGILFDLDGTLIDTYRLYQEAYRRALAPYLGYVPADLEMAARRPSAERHFLTEWLGPDEAAKCHAEMTCHYTELHGSLCEGMYEGVREMLAGLRSAGFPLGIVTGKGRTAWEVTAARVELGAFDTVVTEEDAEYPKPHPGGLLRAAAALGRAPRELVYIGDSAADLEAGRNAGMRIGAAIWAKSAAGEGASYLESVRDHAPEWAFARPADVVHSFARWC